MKRSAALDFLDEAIDRHRRAQLLRERDEPPASPTAGPSFSSNDYLGLARRLAAPVPVGAGASRLLGGDRPAHRQLELAAAQWVHAEDALVFSSGYAANVGVLTALAGPGDLVVSDALNHASLIDGARLSRADIQVVPHLDLAAVEGALAEPRRGRAFVVTESYFSMDADSPDLAALRSLCDRYSAALVVDEAHALGVFGPGGAGLCAAAGITPDVHVGTFGKAFGAAGAFVAGSKSLVLWCWNRARSFVFSTALSPAVAQAALGGLTLAAAEPHRRERVLVNAAALRTGLERLGLRALGHGPIIPWVLGEPGLALASARALQDRGIDARAVRPPTVPSGTSRLRLTVTAEHTASDIAHLLDAVAFVSRRAS